MGHVMQPHIAKIWQSRFGKELKDADYALSHPKQNWMRSHFDYITADGRELVEVKNYNLAAQSKFSDEGDTPRVPAADMAQLIHEAACHGVSTIHLCVLFGGQRFRNFKFEITEREKDELIEEMATYWGYAKAGTTPPPSTVEQCKILFPVDDGSAAFATAQLEELCEAAKLHQAKIKELEGNLDKIESAIRGYMGSKAELVTMDGRMLATWKTSKGSKKFDSTAFKSKFPHIYEQFIFDTVGSRRFLIK
jgi:predicted phage-related endonuclease